MEMSILEFNMLGVFLIVLFCLLVLFIAMFCIFLFVTRSGPDLWSHENEKYFIDPKNLSKIEFPSLKEDASCFLSVVVPAYNEEERLEIMMDEALSHLEYRQKQSKNFTYEVIVVDDGSKDKTSEIALKYSQKYGTSKVRVLTQVKNRGKGGAVRMGVLRTRGKLILFCDADGATKFSDLDRLEAELMKLVNGKVGKEDMAIVCGSRAHLEKDSIAKRSLLRTVLMYGFHFLVRFLCVRGVKDTQCGFKLFTRSAARILFYNLHVHRWAFDVDLLHIAQHYKIPVAEVAVNWTEIPGSKLSPLWASIQMARDLFLIRLRYMTGSWTMVEKRWQNEKKRN